MPLKRGWRTLPSVDFARYSTSASSDGSTHIPRCAIFLVYGWVSAGRGSPVSGIPHHRALRRIQRSERSHVRRPFPSPFNPWLISWAYYLLDSARVAFHVKAAAVCHSAAAFSLGVAGPDCSPGMLELWNRDGSFAGMRSSDIICPECTAGYRRIEVASGNRTTGEYRCQLCDHVLEVFDTANEVAIRLTVQPSKHRKRGTARFRTDATVASRDQTHD
jgi:hypothetical protein